MECEGCRDWRLQEVSWGSPNFILLDSANFWLLPPSSCSGMVGTGKTARSSAGSYL